MTNTIKPTKNNRKHDGRFRKFTIKHNPQAESARAAFHETEDEKSE